MPSGWRVKPFSQISTDLCVRHVARWRVTHPCRSVKSVRRNNRGRVSHRSHRFSHIYIHDLVDAPFMDMKRHIYEMSFC